MSVWQHRRRIGESAGLDHDAREWDDGTLVTAPKQIMNSRCEIAAEPAAQVTRLQLDQAVLARLD
jgi:hypothetical protein